ncbi:QWRF motif-containing protein 2-like [Hibiscus syriacus]|uniref:QWRF motif-containing protein 2-like n=1 Tax=Hibiscus syriacus TaxID=106335 RepID=UPI001920D572|nr:QWRF motif-containing protein 2-like [Hibiscus syriacus]XP_039015287.1 QWRF motif-containing protein 2-like [Hibiscus syriacus]
MMVAALSRPPTPSQSPVEEPEQETNTHQRGNPTVGTAKRPPLKDNGSTVTRKPRGRQVSSRYLSPSPSASSSSSAAAAKTPARFPSPLISRSTNTMSTGDKTTTRFHSPLVSRSTNASSTSTTSSLLPKRSQSVDRRQPGSQLSQGNNVNGAAEMSAATKMLITSTRSLSVSFQGEAHSLPISKTKAQVGSTLIRKATPERRRATPVRDHGENSKPGDQQLWPGRTRQVTPGSGSASHRSLDCGGERKVFGSGTVLAKSLQHSVMLDESSRRVSFDGGSRLSLDLGSSELLKDANKQNPDSNSLTEAHCEHAASDTDSISSGSTNSGTGRSGNLKGKNRPSNIAVSARFWQETNSRLRRLQDPGSPLSSSPGSGIGSPAKFSQSRRVSCDGAVASPMRGSIRPPSPSKLWTSSCFSPSRGLSPGRVRNAVGCKEMSGTAVNTPSIHGFSVDIRRGKKGEDRIVDAHMLRLFYNGYLQWRFANARADATFITQKLCAEKNLWNAWVTTSELRHSVTLKRIKLLLLRQKLKLTSILKRQIAHLEVWALLERDHSSSLLGATEALKASTLRLPIVGKATVDIQNLKDAVSSAVEMMQAMAASVCSLSSKVEEMNSLVAELVSLAAKEKFLLERCKEFLSAIAAIQVKDCSLRSHIIQVNHVSTTSNLTTRVELILFDNSP